MSVRHCSVSLIMLSVLAANKIWTHPSTPKSLRLTPVLIWPITCCLLPERARVPQVDLSAQYLTAFLWHRVTSEYLLYSLMRRHHDIISNINIFSGFQCNCENNNLKVKSAKRSYLLAVHQTDSQKSCYCPLEAPVLSVLDRKTNILKH